MEKKPIKNLMAEAETQEALIIKLKKKKNQIIRKDKYMLTKCQMKSKMDQTRL